MKIIFKITAKKAKKWYAKMGTIKLFFLCCIAFGMLMTTCLDALADTGSTSTTVTFNVPVSTSISCTPGSGTAPVTVLTTVGAVCSYTTNAGTQITGIVSTSVSLTGPTASQTAAFSSATSTNATMSYNVATGSYTASAISSRPIVITFNYQWTPPSTTIGGSYVGTVSISWTAT